MQDQQDMVVRVLSTIAGPLVPPVYKLFMAPWPWAPFLTAFFTPPFFKVHTSVAPDRSPHPQESPHTSFYFYLVLGAGPTL